MKKQIHVERVLILSLLLGIFESYGLFAQLNPDPRTGNHFDKVAVSAPAPQNPDQKSFPVAVPVCSQEEAKEANEFALFLSEASKAVVEGVITERSELPNPQESDYPNCRFTAHFIGNTIQSGVACPKEISLIIEGFKDYVVLTNNNIKTGDKVRCTIIPFEQLKESWQSTQQADDLELFLLDNYYVVDISIINEFSEDNEMMPVSGIFFSDGRKEYISIFERHINPPISERIKKAQTIAIADDLKRMTGLLGDYDEKKIKEINSRFIETWNKEKRRYENELFSENYNRIESRVWRNINNSFWALPEEYTLLSKPVKISKSVLECFQSLKKACESNGVQLIVSLVPNLYVISSRVINNEFSNIPDLQTATYVKQLSEVGIETLYVSDLIIKNFDRFSFAFFYPNNSHPADTTQDCISDILVKRLERYDIASNLNHESFSCKNESTHTYDAPVPFLFPSNCDTGSYLEGSKYECMHIYYDNELVAPQKESPVMLIGNSFIRSPMLLPESLPAYLMYKTDAGIDWYRVSGQGPFSDILVRLLSSPEVFLKDKKVIIMQIGTDHLTNAIRNESMLNIAKLDQERLLLNNMTMKTRVILPSNVSDDIIFNTEIWGPISNVEKTVLKIGESGSFEQSINIPNTFMQGGITNKDKSMICVIPSTCTRDAHCEICVNGIKQQVNSFNYVSNARFFNLVFELPAGMEILSIEIKGKPGTLIAIKDVQFWQ